MKRFNYLFSFMLTSLLLLGVSSCSQDDEVVNVNPQVPIIQTRADANLILVNYLELEGDQYLLNITVEEAESLGVPAELYANAINEVIATNDLIAQIQKDPNHELQLTDPQIALRSNVSIPDETGVLGAPTGTLTTNGQEEAISGYEWAPAGTRQIRFVCRANAALTPGFTCRTYSSGDWKVKTAFGALGTNTTIDVDLFVSNDYVRSAFRTTDSNGGKANYEGI